MVRFINILQFLTRIKISDNLPFDEEFHRGAVYFPVVGLLLGLIYTVLYLLVSWLGRPLAVLLTLTGGILLTGALHLDGLGDTFDGFYSNRSRENRLEIMKDSRLGTNGLLAILLLVLLKLFSLTSLPEMILWRALIIMPVMGRTAMVLGMWDTTYARETGMGHFFIGKIDGQRLTYTLLLAMLPLLLDPVSGWFMGVLWFFAALFKGQSNKLIGGMTGDTLGALCELTEALYLLYRVAIAVK